MYDVDVIGPDEAIPVMLTYHAVPDGRPVSVNATEYNTGSKLIVMEVGSL